MGCYVNPAAVSKEVWLEQNGVFIGNSAPVWGEMPGCLPVCLINNGPFTAAGVAFCPEELAAFNQSYDARPRRWYWAEIDRLREVASGLDGYMRVK